MLEGAYQPIDGLLVEDPAGDVRLTQEVLNQSRVAVNLTVAKGGLGAIEMLYQRKGYTGAIRPDMILLDLNLPKMADRLALQEIKSDAVPMRLPGIFLTPLRSRVGYPGDRRCPRQLLHHQAGRHGQFHRCRKTSGRVVVHHRHATEHRHGALGAALFKTRAMPMPQQKIFVQRSPGCRESCAGTNDFRRGAFYRQFIGEIAVGSVLDNGERFTSPYPHEGESSQ